MVVKVIPQRPIPGILPNNKWVYKEMELDLNKKEITRCMQYGSVYHEDRLIDNVSFLNYLLSVQEPIKAKSIDEVKKLGYFKPVETVVPVEIHNELPSKEESTDTIIKEDDKKEEPKVIIEDTTKIDYTLKIVSIEKSDEYITLTTQFNTEHGKIGGNMYGLFTILGGNRPASLEYKVEDNWVKFNNKFASFSTLENNDEFVFRFAPKNDQPFKFRISIKDGSNELVKLEEEIDYSNL